MRHRKIEQGLSQPFKIASAKTSDFRKECLSLRLRAFNKTMMRVPISSSLLTLSFRSMGLFGLDIAIEDFRSQKYQGSVRYSESFQRPLRVSRMTRNIICGGQEESCEFPTYDIGFLSNHDAVLISRFPT